MKFVDKIKKFFKKKDLRRDLMLVDNIAISAIYDDLVNYKRLDLAKDHEPEEIEEQLNFLKPALHLKAKVQYRQYVQSDLDDIVSINKNKWDKEKTKNGI